MVIGLASLEAARSIRHLPLNGLHSRSPTPGAAEPSRGDAQATAPPSGEPAENVSPSVGSAATDLPSDRAAWLIAENARPGTAAWRIPKGARTDIEGYADHVSAVVGDVVTLYVSTGAGSFHVEAYRLGYYQGRGARFVWRSRSIPGTRQRAPLIEPVTNMVEARWKPSVAVPVTERWVPGCYVLKLVASDGAQSYVPLTVRDETSHAALVIQNSATTWQAYNSWGGYSLYAGPTGAFDRSRIVSFDRPYAIGHGAGDLVDGNERTVISLVEELGLDVTYWTDIDLAERPTLLQNHRALITLGHDEYWSTSMLDGVERARNGGLNVAFLGANAAYRHIRLQASPLGRDREEVDYKDAAEDPLYGVRNEEVTADWSKPPLNRPESELTGAMYECNPVHASMRFVDTPAWLFRHSGLRPGHNLSGLVGAEYDHVLAFDPTPATIEVLAHSPVFCGGPSYSDMTYYTTAADAGVFDSGTSVWTTAIGMACVLEERCTPSQRTVERVTENLLRAFASGPAGLRSPSRSNLRSLGIELSRPLHP